jgi:hypothetical protein
MHYLAGKKIIRVRKASYEIVFDGRQINIFALAVKRKPHAPNPLIANAWYHVHGNTVMFDSASISHRSPRVVQELAEAVEAAFKEANPKVVIRGQGVWFRTLKQPVPFSLSGPRRTFPQRARKRTRPA